MQRYEFLRTLLDFEPTEFPFVSVYLNTEPNENGKKDFDIFLKKQLKDHGAVMEPDSPELESYNADVEKIENFVSGLDPATRGAAIFACSGADGFFERFEFMTPFNEDEFALLDRPLLFPIVRLVSRKTPFAVVAADTNSAHIYQFKRGRVVDVEDIENVKTNRTEVGGWSQMRYQRHVENFHQQHAKEVMEEIEKLCRDEKIDRVILSGDETRIIPLLKEEMSNFVEERFVGTLSLPVDSPDHEVREAAVELLSEKEAEIDKEKIDNLMEQNYADGLGVTGVEKTLQALLNGQVQELYVLNDMGNINFHRDTVQQLLRNYQPGEDDEMPDPRERSLVIDELLKQAIQSADEIRFIKDPHLLKAQGGVGALLRFQVKGASTL